MASGAPPLRQLAARRPPVPSIGFLFGCCMVGAALIVMLVAGRAVVRDSMDYRSHVEAIDAQTALDAALRLMEKVALERGPTFSLLTGTAAVDGTARQAVDAARAATRASMAELRRRLARLQDYTDTPVRARVAVLAGAVDGLDATWRESRRVIDEGLARPPGARETDLTEVYAGAEVTLQKNLVPLLNGLQARVAVGAPDAASIVQIARYAADLREIAGLQASLVTAPIAEARPFIPQELAAAERMEGELDRLSTQVDAAIGYVGEPPALVAAWRLAQAGYFTQGRAMIDQVLTGARAGRYPTPLPAFIKVMVTQLPSLIALRDAASAAATEKAANSRDTAWTSVVVSSLVLILVIAAVVGLMAWFRRVVVLPLIGLTKKVDQLASGDHDVEIDLIDRRDEIGGLARAMRSFRDALRETDRLRAAQARAQAATEAANRAVQVANLQLESRVQERTSELLAAQQEIIKKERLSAIGQLTATVAHELRNPLGAIRNTVVTLRAIAGDSNSELERPVSRIERSVVRCDKIVAELLDFARTGEPKLRPLVGDRWLDMVIDEISLPSGITIERYLQAPAVRVALDHERFRRVLVNLIDNAAQAIQSRESDGENVIRISTRATAAYEVIVEDTGAGISPENLPRIFEPLFTTKSAGTGLGLPTVRQIVEQHRGTITVASEVGQGTTVTLRIPFWEQQDEIAA